LSQLILAENLQYFEISAKSNVGCRLALLRVATIFTLIVQLREAFPLARPQARRVSCWSFIVPSLFFNIRSNQSLEFVAAPALAPPEVQVDPELIAKYEDELKQAANAPLPDEVRSVATTFRCHC
jgi:hypothetical protein